MHPANTSWCDMLIEPTKPTAPTEQESVMKNVMENVTFDELQIGQSARLVRTLTLQDIQAFAAVSGDVNPAHMNPEYAQDTLFHGVIAHGMWGGALISAVFGTQFPGPGTIYLSQDLKFIKPVRVATRSP